MGDQPGIERRIFKASSRLAVLLLRVAFFVALALATSDKDEAWRKLIGQAVKRGGVETDLDKTGSYVLVAPNGMTITFTLTLDNKSDLSVRYIEVSPGNAPSSGYHRGWGCRKA
jgi:hypothetical protein